MTWPCKWCVRSCNNLLKSALKSVVFPEPEGPMMARSRPPWATPLTSWRRYRVLGVWI